jgi:lipooligosaccharide transport system permease protein
VTTLLARVAPPTVRPSHRFRHLLEHNYLVYRSVWWVIVAGFFEPVFYLFSIGIGLGQLIGDVSGPTGELVPYAAFVAPAMLAASAMNGAVYESTFNIFFKIRYGNTYKAILATPVGPGDIAVGEILWSLFRAALYSGGFIIVMAVMGLVDSPWGVLALPATLLIGFAFGAVGMAATTFMRSWQDFDLVNMVTLPLFLFSATFYPLDVYPEFFQRFTQFSPLYHGTELVRSLTLGAFDSGLWVNIAVLVGMGLAGSAVIGRRLERLLLS